LGNPFVTYNITLTTNLPPQHTIMKIGQPKPLIIEGIDSREQYMLSLCNYRTNNIASNNKNDAKTVTKL